MRLLLIALICYFTAFVWVPVEWGYLASCFNNYDLGIYGQAISLLDFDRLNPWLSTREVFVFGDHFDPILLLAAPLRQFWSPSLVMIRMEMVSLLIAAAAPVWLCARGLVSRPMAVLASAMMLLGPMTLDAAFYPAHPGTWSLAPLSWMMAFMFAGYWRGVFIAMILTFLCKEEYPAATLMLGGVLWWQGHRLQGLWMAIISGLWLVGVFLVRPLYLGSASMYADAVSSGSGLAMLGHWDEFVPLLKRLLCLMVPALWMWFAAGRSRHVALHFLFGISAMLAAMIGVRLLGGYWGHHRSAPLSIFAAYLVIAIAADYVPTKRAAAGIWMMAAILILPGLEPGTRLYRGRDFKRHCPHDPQRLTAINDAELMIRAGGDGPVLAQGNLVPRLVDLPGTSQVGATKASSFRYFLSETHAYRNPWPLTVEAYSQIEQTWRSNPHSRVLLDTPWILLIRNEAYRAAEELN